MTRVKNPASFRRPRRLSTVEYEIQGDESVSTAVVRVVSAVLGHDPRSLRPLGDVVDPGALDTLFDPQYDGTPRTGGRLSFVYNGCRITIDNGEYLTLRSLDHHVRDGRDSESTDGRSR